MLVAIGLAYIRVLIIIEIGTQFALVANHTSTQPVAPEIGSWSLMAVLVTAAGFAGDPI